MGLRVIGLSACLVLAATAFSPTAKAQDGLYWDGVDDSIFVAHPDVPNTYVLFRLDCDDGSRDGEPGHIYRAWFDLGWTEPMAGNQIVTVTIDGQPFPITTTAGFSEMDEVYILSGPVPAPGAFLNALANGNSMTMAAAGLDFTVALVGTAPLVQQLIANCTVPLQ